MKFFNLVAKYKYPIVVVLLFIVSLLCISFIIQGLKKDHSLDMTKQELKLKEETRLQIEKERAAWQQVVNEQEINIQVLRVKDSVVQNYVFQLNDQIGNLSKKYNEKAKVINAYGSDDLREYFRNLPKQPDNDY